MWFVTGVHVVSDFIPDCRFCGQNQESRSV